jgi:hypothetical protein
LACRLRPSQAVENIDTHHSRTRIGYGLHRTFDLHISLGLPGDSGVISQPF